MKRFLLWLLAILVVVVMGIVLAFRFSPWPSVAVIQYVFAKSDRASAAALARHVPPGITAKLDISYGTGPDERLDVFHREDATGPQPTVVWVHGGGFVAGSKEAVANYLKVIADAGYTVVNVGYSTGFGSVYPRPIEQLNTALAYVEAHAVEHNIDSQRLVLAGSSAGAQIAAQTALLITDADYAGKMEILPMVDPAQLRGAVLVSGAFDMESARTDSWLVNAVLWAYTGVRDFMNDPRFMLASIPQNVTPGFPPAFITSGNGDPLLNHAEALVSALEAAGVPTDVLFFPADYEPPLPHEFQFNLDIPAGQEALARMLAFLRSRA